MEFNIQVTTNLHFKEFDAKLKEARKAALKDVVIDIAHDSVKDSPVKTGNNRRSLAFEIEGMAAGKSVLTGESKEDVGVKEGEGAVYSTSGYGGFLEVGTSKMPARPYMKVAADRYFTEANVGKLIEEHLKD